MEHSHVQFGRTASAYVIERGRRHKTVAIAVDPVLGVRVRAPKDMPVEKLDRIVHRKAKWILERRRLFEDLPPPATPRELISGETFLYLGRQYRLQVAKNASAEASVAISGAYLRVPGRRAVRDQLIAWYRQRAQERVEKRVMVWAARLGVQAGRVLVREQKGAHR